MKVPSSKKEWIEYIVKNKAVPIWSDTVDGNVYFRRLTGPVSKTEELFWGRHVAGKKTRQRVAEILGIVTKKDCKRVRDLIRARIL